MRVLRGVMGRIGWETFARARAKLDAGLDRDAVLAEVGLDPEAWSREQEALLAELADEVERADFARLEAYRAAYQATWTRVTDLAIPEPRQGGESAAEPMKLPAFHDPMPPVEVQQASFQRGAPVAPWLPAASPVQPEPSQIASVPDEHPIDATLPPSGMVPRDPLPFQHAASPQAAPWQEGVSSHRLPPPPPPPLLPGATIAPPLAGSSPVLPFEPPSAATRLTLDQYASLCAELAVFPHHVEATFHKYGLASLRERLTIDLAWQERLRRNPTELAAWQELYRRYQAYWVHTAHHDG